MDNSVKDINVESLVESCRPSKKRGRPSHKRQLLEIREEGKLNLQTSDSVVLAIQLKSILTRESLQSLPNHSQTQLIRLLPGFDQIRNREKGTLEASETAMSNEYFRRFCSKFSDKLANNKFSSESLEQARAEKSKELCKLDPWKLKNFEPIWGHKLISQNVDDEDENMMLDKLLKQAYEMRNGVKRAADSHMERRRIKKRCEK